jgi:hypothetical protein
MDVRYLGRASRIIASEASPTHGGNPLPLAVPALSAMSYRAHARARAAIAAVLAACLLQATPASASASPVFDALASAVFLHNGTVYDTDSYAYQPIQCGYLEPENVTCAQCGWGEGGGCPYLYAVNGTAPPQNCSVPAASPGYDRPGGDMSADPITGGLPACQARCCATSGCVAYVWLPAAPSPFLDCTAGAPCCYLKGSVPQPVNSSIPGITSGVVNKTPLPVTVPPMGMRSAVPLGGVGAGAFEVRADGRVHEMTIQNQSPGGAAKYGVVDELVMGVYAAPAGGAAAAKMVRTVPPVGVPAAAGVASITYSGSYPLSRRATRWPAACPPWCSRWRPPTRAPRRRPCRSCSRCRWPR